MVGVREQRDAEEHRHATGGHHQHASRRHCATSGGLKAGTPFETASTPVIAVQPFENARRSRNSVSGDAVATSSAAGAGGDGPGQHPPGPDANQREDRRDEEIRRHGEDAAGLADAAQIAEHQYQRRMPGVSSTRLTCQFGNAEVIAATPAATLTATVST